MTTPDAQWISLAAAIDLARGAYGDDGVQSLIRGVRERTIEIYFSVDHFTPPPARLFEGFGPNYMEAAIADWKLDIWSLIETRLGFGNSTEGHMECFDLIAGDFDATIQIGSTGERFYHQIRGLRLNRVDIERVLELSGTITPLEGTEVASRKDRTGIGGAPKKYDWEMALAHVAAVANTPNGIPTGVSDEVTNADVTKLLTAWFVQKIDKEPSSSEVRKRASYVLSAINALKKQA